MRWKLLIITSLVAALINTGGTYALIYWARGTAVNPDGTQRALTVAFIGIPFIFVTLAAIFIYRHTARRRKLQALLSVLLSITLTLAALYAVTIVVDRSTPDRRWHTS